jgi:ribonuclease HI
LEKEVNSTMELVSRKLIDYKLLRYILRCILIPRLKHIVGTTYPGKTTLGKLDGFVRKMIKMKLRLSSKSCNILLYHPDFLDFPSISSCIERHTINTYVRCRYFSEVTERLFSSFETYGNKFQSFVTKFFDNYNIELLSKTKEDHFPLKSILGGEFDAYRLKLSRARLFQASDYLNIHDLELLSSVPERLKKKQWFQRIIHISRTHISRCKLPIKTSSPCPTDLRYVEIWTDGSLDLGNRTMGCGYLILKPNGECLLEGSFRLISNELSSTMAECWAVLEALKKIDDGTTCTIYTDSNNVIHSFSNIRSSIYDQNAEAETFAYIVEKQNLKIKWVKVKAHTGDMYNEYVDKLANKGRTSGMTMSPEYQTRNGKFLFLVKGIAPRGGLIDAISKIQYEKTLSIAKNELPYIGNLFRNLTDSNAVNSIILSKISCKDYYHERPLLRSFNYRRLTCHLPTAARLKEWNLKEDDKCRCGEKETQEHFFRCTRKRDVISRLSAKFNILTKSYCSKYTSIEEEDMIKALTYCFYPKSCMISILQMKLPLEKEWVKSVMDIITIDAYQSLWI